MKPILIKDGRLTPDLERSRNGPKSGFRNKGSRSFDNDFELIPPKKSLYAELIEGKWYWVEGCSECLGKKRDKWGSYVECEVHDRCEICEILRTGIKATPWGWVNGWVCAPCYDKVHIAERKAALLEFAANPVDTDCTDEVLCPYCGKDYEVEMECFGRDNVAELECATCDGKFKAEVEFSHTFTTTKEEKNARS